MCLIASPLSLGVLGASRHGLELYTRTHTRVAGMGSFHSAGEMVVKQTCKWEFNFSVIYLRYK